MMMPEGVLGAVAVLGPVRSVDLIVERVVGIGERDIALDAPELISRAITQARKFGARTATPYRALALVPGDGAHRIELEDGCAIVARHLPLAGLEDYEGLTIFYAAGPPEARACAGTRVGVVGGGNSAWQAAVWLARGGALVTLLHRRADLRETMSDYLIRDLDRHGVAVRDRSEVAELHGAEGELEAVTLKVGERLPFGTLFCFLGADPCTDWLGDTLARDEHGFILTGDEAVAAGLYETSVRGIYAAGDVRAGSTKRAATAVGEGAAVVGFVHRHLAGGPATP